MNHKNVKTKVGTYIKEEKEGEGTEQTRLGGVSDLPGTSWD